MNRATEWSHVKRWSVACATIAAGSLFGAAPAHAVTASCVSTAGFQTGWNGFNNDGFAYSGTPCTYSTPSGGTGGAVVESDADLGVLRANATGFFATGESVNIDSYAVWRQGGLLIEHPDASGAAIGSTKLPSPGKLSWKVNVGTGVVTAGAHAIAPLLVQFQSELETVPA